MPDRSPEQIADIMDVFEQEFGSRVFVNHPWGEGLDNRIQSRSVFVMGVARSGTSVVSGILHHLGVSMLRGEVPQGVDNVTGTFEDPNFLILGIQRNSDPYTLTTTQRQLYASLIRGCQSQLYIWGVKEPRLMYVFKHLLPVLEDPRIIYVTRNLDAVRASWAAPGTEQRIEGPHLESQLGAFNEVLDTKVPGMVLEYEDIVAHPGAAIDKIAEFAYSGFTERPKAWQYVRAERFVDPALNHYKGGQ